jgi:putative tricarboxylic transport membrane protein
LKSKTANIIGCIFFILIGIWFLVNSLFLSGTQNAMDVGPSAFPILSSAGIILASGVYLVREVRKGKKDEAERITIRNQNKVLLSMIFLVAYVMVMQMAGYYIASVLFIPIVLFTVGVRRLVQLVPLSAGFVLFAYVVFDVLLGVPMP